MLTKFIKIELITPSQEYLKILSQVSKMDKETLRVINDPIIKNSLDLTCFELRPH
jgi:hypothetical protein